MALRQPPLALCISLPSPASILHPAHQEVQARHWGRVPSWVWAVNPSFPLHPAGQGWGTGAGASACLLSPAHTRGLPHTHLGRPEHSQLSTPPSTGRDIPFSVLYFPLFANLNSLGVQELTGKASFAHSFMSGCAAGSIAAITVTPLDGKCFGVRRPRGLTCSTDELSIDKN